MACLLKNHIKMIPFCSRYFVDRMLHSVATKFCTNKKTRESYITKSVAAEMLITNLKKDLLENDVFIVCDPVNGILVKHLLELNKFILLLKPTTNLITKLNEVYPSQIKNITVCDFDLSDICFNIFWSSKYAPKNDRYLQLINTLQSFSGPSSNLKMIAVSDSFKHLHSIGMQYSYQEILFQDYLKPSFYLFIPLIFCHINSSDNYHKLKEYKKTWRLFVYFKTFFDITILGTQPLDCFKLSTQYYKRAKNSSNSKLDKICLIKLVPKDVSILKEQTGGNLLLFQYFIDHALQETSYNPLITILEEFIPTCSEELIHEGFRMTDYPFKLSFEQWLRAFQIFTNHPEFKSSYFINQFKFRHEGSGIFMDYEDNLLRDVENGEFIDSQLWDPEVQDDIDPEELLGNGEDV